MPDVTVQIDERQIRRVTAMLRAIPRGFPKAATRAINHVAAKVKTRAIRAIAQGAGIKAKYVRRRVKLYRASFRKLYAKIWIGGARVPVIWLKGIRQTRKGVMRPTPWGRVLLESAFIATMPSGHRGVFRRAGRARLPIEEQYTEGPAEVFDKVGGLAGRLMRQASIELAERLNHEVGRLLEQHQRRVA